MKIDQRTSLFALHQERVLYRVKKMTHEENAKGFHFIDAWTEVNGKTHGVAGCGPTLWEAIEDAFKMIRRLHAEAEGRSPEAS